MTKFIASYNGQNGPSFGIESNTELGAKRKATEMCACGHSIALIELDESGEQLHCVASKEWGNRWVSENI